MILIAPVSIWLVHIFILVPHLGSQSGDAAFISAVTFFMVAALIMLICFVLSIILLIKNEKASSWLPVILNLTWLYYVKVLLFGTTFGNF